MRNQEMVVQVLGCGTSSGVPLIGCRCEVCQSSDPKNSRFRASLRLDIQGKSLLIDASPDLRSQALKFGFLRVDALLLTHPHADHIGGIDELRSFNYLQGNQAIPTYVHEWTERELKTRYSYLFQDRTYAKGGGIAKLDLKPFQLNDVFDVQGISVQSFALPHGDDWVAGFRVGDFAYLTDCHEVPDVVCSRLQGLEVLVLDCLRIEPHGTHLNLERALYFAEKIKAKRTVLTHMGHEFEFEKFSNSLPPSIEPAFDGMMIQLP